MQKTIFAIRFYVICLSVFSFCTVSSFATPNEDIYPETALDDLRAMENALRDKRDDIQDAWDIVDQSSAKWATMTEENRRKTASNFLIEAMGTGFWALAGGLDGRLESEMRSYYANKNLMDLYSDELENVKSEIHSFYQKVKLYKSAHATAVKIVNKHKAKHHDEASPSNMSLHDVPSLKKKTCRDKLPSFSCRGNHAAGKTVCNVSYNTPKKAFYTHREVCGEEEDAYYTNRNRVRTHISGDGIAYYTCDTAANDRHRVRSCTRDFTDGSDVTSTCGDGFRRCVGHKKDHDHSNVWNWETKHSDAADSSTASASPGFAPASGSSNTASAGDTHTGKVTAPSIYGVWLYVNGTKTQWFSGSTTATSLSLTYTFASDASGSYTMMARVYPWSGSTYGNYTDYSYTVTIGSSDSTTTPTSTPSTPSTPSYHACGSHTTDVSGDHTLQASCTSTDSNGQYCTVTSFYACQTHTHVYPSSNNNGNNGNNGDSTMATCEDCGVEYDSSDDMYTHITFTCVWCGTSYKPCGGTTCSAYHSPDGEHAPGG
ncbi:MAG: hypothetical protein OXN27_18980 [Candidatus Poribacteria bacterium]|nr:hypothetical protein [Candidatus Poribacteria bacterium]